MLGETPTSPRITIRRPRWGRYALRALALLAGAVCTSALAGTLQGRALVAAPVSASSAAGAGGADALHLPGSWEGELPGADGTVRWHLDLLPEQRYRLRRTYEGKPAPNRFDEIGRWARAADSPRLDLYVAGEKRVQFLVEADGSLRKLDTAGKPIASGLNDRLERLPRAALIEPRLKISGLFIYMADAAVITLCDDGSRVPVAMEGDFRALQAAYMKARPAPGKALLASVEGRIATRPSMEESLPPLDTLVVERFISLSPHGSCGRAPGNRPLRGTYWKLVRLGEAQVEVSAGQTEPHVVFASDALQVSGSGGCNRIAGGFTLEADRVHLGPLAGTMMACINGMKQEQHFLKSLNQVERYRISGQQLELLDASGAVLARFEAAAPR
jgi:copper homeostasis protein (lipoprotein)